MSLCRDWSPPSGRDAFPLAIDSTPVKNDRFLRRRSSSCSRACSSLNQQRNKSRGNVCCCEKKKFLRQENTSTFYFINFNFTAVHRTFHFSFFSCRSIMCWRFSPGGSLFFITTTAEFFPRPRQSSFTVPALAM